MAKRDYYEVLGVGRDANDEQIKGAYRRMARKHHPDVNKASDAAERFKEATEAYEVLSDPERRKAYNQFGHTGMPGAGAWSGGGWPGGGARGGPREGFSVSFEDVMRAAQGARGARGFMGMGLDEILKALRGGFGGRKRGKASARTGGQHLQQEITIGFLQAVRGTTATVRIRAAGETQATRTETLDVKIPAGVREGAKIRVRGKGQEGADGRGDLYIVVHIREHPYFRRQGDDIHVEVPIGITEAALGAKVDVPTLDGMTTVTVPPGIGSARRLRLRGKGVSRPGRTGRGDQYVEIRIVAPSAVSARGADLLRQFQDTESYDPRADVPWR